MTDLLRPSLPDPSEGLRTGRSRTEGIAAAEADQRLRYARELRRIERKRRKEDAVRDEALALGFSYSEASDLQRAHDNRVFWRRYAAVMLLLAAFVILALLLAHQ